MAASMGRRDMTVTRDQLLAHVADLAAATDLPLSVDAERGYGADPAGVADTVRLLADAGAAGCSIEDWDPVDGQIDPIGVSVERVAAAVAEARRHGLVVTARCEHHLRGVDDLDATIERLVAYRDAGAECVYAPGLIDPAQIRRLVEATDTAVNVLLLPGGPTVADLAALGVRRVSLGGRLSNTAYGAVVAQATAIRDTGAIDPALPALAPGVAAAAFES